MNVLTFDVEDWFHLLDYGGSRNTSDWGSYESRLHGGVERILRILDRHQQRATFFILGWVADEFPETVRRICSAGHEIGSHSYGHQLIYEQTPEEFEQDLIRSVRALNKVVEGNVRYYRAPGFSLIPGCEWVFPILQRHGIKVDCSIFPAARAHGGYVDGMPPAPFIVRFGDSKLVEMPLNIASVMGRRLVYSGGGYFRLLPYQLIRRFVARSNYTMTYFHPRDFDIGQPILPKLPMSRRFRTYVGISGAEEKLDRLLKEFSWISVGEAVSRLSNVPIVDVVSDGELISGHA